jgi:hypothetical protein
MISNRRVVVRASLSCPKQVVDLKITKSDRTKMCDVPHHLHPDASDYLFGKTEEPTVTDSGNS